MTNSIMKTISFVVMCVLLFSVASCNKIGKKESPVEDFEYEFENGEVIITAYIGSDFDIVIPKKIDDRPVTTIGEDAFRGYGVASIVFPETLTTINEHAFLNCDSLTEIKLPKSLTFIGAGAFDGCAITSLEIPENVSFDWRGAYTYSGGYMKRIYSPVDYDVVLYVKENSASHNELLKYEEIKHNFNGELKFEVR